jgi:NADPH:quinone reductase-like Zn-dependent oxidoreductase
MKIAQFEKTGKPAEVLEIVEVDMLQPGPGEVRVKVTTCNINPSDIMFVQGLYGITPQLPAVGGFEAAGVIDEVGEGVPFKAGQRVIFTGLGVWQEYVIVNAKGLIPTPDSMSDEVACQAFVNPFTAYAMLEEAKLQEGDWLMVTAGASAFGKFVIQMCKERGIKTICTVRRNAQIDLLKSLGATEVVNSEEGDVVRFVKDVTEGKGVNCAFDAVGGDLGGLVVDCLGRNGLLLVFGLMSLMPTPINAGVVIFKNLTIKGFWLTTWMTSRNMDELHKVTKTVLTLLASNQLKADIEATYSLDQIKEAVLHAEKPGKNGKVLLDLR